MFLNERYRGKLILVLKCIEMATIEIGGYARRTFH